MADNYETRQRILDPDRVQEQRLARQEADDRLRTRGIWVHASDDDEGVADLLDAIEQFEAVVESQGGDLHVDRIGSTSPDKPAFVPPVRGLEESIADYRLRITAATDRLLHGRHR